MTETCKKNITMHQVCHGKGCMIQFWKNPTDLLSLNTIAFQLHVYLILIKFTRSCLIHMSQKQFLVCSESILLWQVFLNNWNKFLQPSSAMRTASTCGHSRPSIAVWLVPSLIVPGSEHTGRKSAFRVGASQESLCQKHSIIIHIILQPVCLCIYIDIRSDKRQDFMLYMYHNAQCHLG